MSQQFRASAAISASWSDGHLLLENHLAPSLVRCPNHFLRLVEALQEWRTLAELVMVLGLSDSDELEQSLLVFCDAGLVHRDPDEFEAERRLAEAWGDELTAARKFHWSTRDAPFGQVSAEEIAQLFDRPQPASYKTLTDPVVQQLPPPELVPMPLDQSLRKRRTVRVHAEDEVPLAALSTLIYYTWGQTGFRDGGAFGPLVAKTSPSGGSRHSIECYLIAQRVEDVPTGIYHYSVAEHRLERVAGLPDTDLLETFGQQEWVRDAPAIFVMTSVFDRVFWKYRFSRSYRVITLDAGHLGQTFSLVATALGLGPGTTAAFKDSAIENLLNIDGITEGAIYVAVVGKPGQSRDGG